MELFDSNGNLQVDVSLLKKVCEEETFSKNHAGFWDQNCSIIRDKLDSIKLTNLENAKNTIVSRRIRFKPTTIQKVFLKECFGIYRYIYNEAINVLVDIIRFADKFNCNIDLRLIEYALYQEIKLNDNEVKEWMKVLPLDSRREAVKEALKNYKTCETHIREGLSKKYLLKHKKDDTNVFIVKANAIKLTDKGLIICRDRIMERIRKHIVNTKGACNKKLEREYAYFRYAHIDDKNKQILSEFINGKGNPTSYPNLQMINGKFYLLVSGERNANTIENKKDICSIDPGIVNFHTIYDIKQTYICGERLYEKEISYINYRIDKIVSKKTKSNNTKWKKLHNREMKLRAKVSNKIHDFHCRLAKKLCDTYKVILLPSLNITQLSRRLQTITNRKMFVLSHYKFNTLLSHIAQRTGTTVINCLESYTSKTCGNCGNMYNVIGRVFDCPQCEYIEDRDKNASRNIMIRCLNKYLLSTSGKRN